MVVLHGGPAAPGSVGDLARALGAWFRVHEPWQRRADDRPLTVARHVEDLAEVAPASAVLVGHSAGAMWGLSYAAAHPGRVRGLVLIGCGTYDAASRDLFRQRMDAARGDDGRRRYELLREELAAATDETARDRILAALGDLADAAMDPDARSVPDDPDAPPVDARGHAETWADHLRLQAEGREPAAFAAYRGPVTLLQGTADPHPGDAIRDTLLPYLPQLVYEPLTGAGHSPWRSRTHGAHAISRLRHHIEAMAHR